MHPEMLLLLLVYYGFFWLISYIYSSIKLKYHQFQVYRIIENIFRLILIDDSSIIYHEDQHKVLIHVFHSG
jgi:phosphate starvation-inducible membrane PsiE